MPIQGNAGGTIVPSRFVKLSTTADHQFLQAAANDKIVGISQKGTRNTPYPSLDDGNAALSGEDLLIYQQDETAILELGGTVTAGDYLESDANGKGVTSSTDGHNYGAICPVAGVAGDLVEVRVAIGMRGA